MSAKITLFLVFSVWVSLTSAEFRFFPDKMNKIPQYEYTTSHSFLRSLEEFNVNSQSTDIISNPDPSSLVSVKLRGSTELGYYYITLFFGTPIQRQTLIVDTGSSITTIPCKGLYSKIVIM